MKVISKSLQETGKFAQDFLLSLKEEGTVVGLYGNLGSGKTTFTQLLAKELKVKEFVTSPTFVIEKIYKIQHPYYKRLIHIDAYRLKEAAELQTLGFEEIVGNPHNLIIIEWPENVQEILPKHHIQIHCSFIDEVTRQYEVQYHHEN